MVGIRQVSSSGSACSIDSWLAPVLGWWLFRVPGFMCGSNSVGGGGIQEPVLTFGYSQHNSLVLRGTATRFFHHGPLRTIVYLDLAVPDWMRGRELGHGDVWSCFVGDQGVLRRLLPVVTRGELGQVSVVVSLHFVVEHLALASRAASGANIF